jgi:hypothetical protein
MPEEIMVIVILFFGCFTGITITALNLFAGRLKGGNNPRLEAEIAALRKEIGELKAISSDMVLSLDSTLQHQSALLQSMEKRALGDGTLPRYTGVVAGAAGSAAESVETRTGV